MPRCKYKLTLEVEDYGIRSFTATGEFECQGEMEAFIPYDIARALRSTMLDPPTAMAVAGAINEGSSDLVKAFAYIFETWDAENDIEKCVKLMVDIGRLCGTDSDKDQRANAQYLRLLGIEVVGEPALVQE